MSWPSTAVTPGTDGCRSSAGVQSANWGMTPQANNHAGASAKMPLLSRRCAAEKSSLRSLNALLSKAFRAFDPIRGGLPPPRAPPPDRESAVSEKRFSKSCGGRRCPLRPPTPCYGFFMVRLMRFFFSSTSRTHTVTTSPTESSWEGCFTRWGSLLMWTSPS